MRETIIKTTEDKKIVAIIRGVEREKLLPLAEALYGGGIRLLEVTYDATGRVSDAETAENIRLLAERFADRMYIGAGTVLTEEQVVLTRKAGGGFIISPDTYDRVIHKTRELEMVSMPGAFTPSEIQTAARTGADFVKIFPITDLGSGYVKAVKAPLPHIRLLAVGGIHTGNMKEYIDAGIAGFGIGSNIVDKRLLAVNDFDGLRALAKQYIDVIA